jgi:hypothetical protein
MLEALLQDIDEQLLDSIVVDGFNWLIERVGDNSVKLNNINYSENRRPFSKKKMLLLRWSYSREELGLKRDFLAVMEYTTNQIKLYCDRRATLGTILNHLFHEYCHSQQSSYLYAYYTRRVKVNYYQHPLEREANEFAEKMTPIYWQENSWKFEKLSLD